MKFRNEWLHNFHIIWVYFNFEFQGYKCYQSNHIDPTAIGYYYIAQKKEWFVASSSRNPSLYIFCIIFLHKNINIKISPFYFILQKFLVLYFDRKENTCKTSKLWSTFEINSVTILLLFKSYQTVPKVPIFWHFL